MKKKLIAAGLCLTMAFSLVACTGTNNQNINDKQETEIQMTQEQKDMISLLETRVKAFNKDVYTMYSVHELKTENKDLQVLFKLSNKTIKTTQNENGWIYTEEKSNKDLKEYFIPNGYGAYNQITFVQNNQEQDGYWDIKPAKKYASLHLFEPDPAKNVEKMSIQKWIQDIQTGGKLCKMIPGNKEFHGKTCVVMECLSENGMAFSPFSDEQYKIPSKDPVIVEYYFDAETKEFVGTRTDLTKITFKDYKNGDVIEDTDQDILELYYTDPETITLPEDVQFMPGKIDTTKLYNADLTATLNITTKYKTVFDHQYATYKLFKDDNSFAGWLAYIEQESPIYNEIDDGDYIVEKEEIKKDQYMCYLLTLTHSYAKSPVINDDLKPVFADTYNKNYYAVYMQKENVPAGLLIIGYDKEDLKEIAADMQTTLSYDVELPPMRIPQLKVREEKEPVEVKSTETQTQPTEENNK